MRTGKRIEGWAVQVSQVADGGTLMGIRDFSQPNSYRCLQRHGANSCPLPRISDSLSVYESWKDVLI